MILQFAKNLPKKTFSSERDRKLKEEQKNLKSRNDYW